jgi:hypothetical protein
MKIGDVTITSGSSNFPGVKDRTDWTQREIRGSEKKTVMGSWFGAIFPLVVGSLFFWHAKMPFFIAKNVPNPVWGMMLLVSAGFLLKAIWETIRLRRFGDPVLKLNAAPIPLGGTVEGRINFTSGAENSPEFTVTLACIHRVHRNKNVTEKVLWTADTQASMLLGGILPISVAVPPDQPPTSGSNPFDCILWRLTVKAPFRGMQFLEKYEVPVGQAP